MELIVYKDINEVAAPEWNELITEKDIFHRYEFLKTLNCSKVEDAEMYFLLFKKNGKILGSAVLSAFEINLDLFIGNNKFVQSLKKIFPRLFKVSILFCGTPISAGHKNIYIKDKSDLQGALVLLSNYMDGFCTKHRINFSVFKEFGSSEAESMNPLIQKGYFKAHSLPTVIMDLPFKSYEAYLKQLRYTYRRQIKSSLGKINCSRPVFVENYLKQENHITFPFFSILDPGEYSPSEFYHLYCSVMKRAKVKLEMLNHTFFENLFVKAPVSLKILAMIHQGEILGVFILSLNQDELTFIWTGKDQHKDKFDTYSNLMNAMVDYGIRMGCSKIIMGQTSYYLKQRLGGKTQTLYLFFKAHHKWKNTLFKLLNKQIFPETPLNLLKVFKPYGE